ncbi:MAG: methyltransferase type 11 [Phototrophicales bacterium]|nr:MAG: methyltransferase type 11 [Phototrophicales bacterium]
MTDLPMEYFAKQDSSDDSLFYQFARKVVHIDDGAIRALSDQFGALLPKNAVLLDLMSSWRSHLPASITPARVVGLGMNAEEMADNPALTEYVVHNLNKDPILPFADGIFDAAICTVSVQYLQRPIEVFREVGRVCKANAPFVVSFSNRCFPTKAVAVWLATTDNQHMALVARYFEDAGSWSDIQAWAKPRRFSGDPLYIVWAKRSP